MTTFSWLRLRPFDISTEEGRDRERYRRAGLTTLASALSRGAVLAVMFVSLRVALPYLGEARFGVWMTMASLATLLMVFDFGIGNALVSRVAALAARSDWAALSRLLALALCTLSLIGIAVAVVLACIAAYGPVGWLYRNASPALIAEARRALVLFSVLFGMSIPLQTLQRVYAGLQEGYFSLTIAGVLSLLSLVLVPFLPAMHAGIAGFLAATYGMQVASGALLLITLARRFKLALPRASAFRTAEMRLLVGSGGLFFLLQVASVIGWDMDTVLVSALVGPAAVAVYAVVQQMFLLVSGPLSMLNAPLWGSYADAHTRGEVRYLRSTLRRSLLGTCGLAVLGAAIIWAVHTPLSGLLTRSVVQLPGGFVVIFALWTVVSATGNAFAMYLNGLHILVPQVVTSLLFVAVALLVKLLLIGSYGLNGVVGGTLISYLLTIALPYLTVFRKPIATPLGAAKA